MTCAVDGDGRYGKAPQQAWAYSACITVLHGHGGTSNALDHQLHAFCPDSTLSCSRGLRASLYGLAALIGAMHAGCTGLRRTRLPTHDDPS